jgi:tRNA(fMet)-specific endonuclease VapC
VIRHWRAGAEKEYAISSICELEVLYGIAIARSERLARAYRDILKNRFPVLPVDSRVAEAYAGIQAASMAQGKARPCFDLLIAATALVYRLRVATCNPRDFMGISGLEVEDWTEG